MEKTGRKLSHFQILLLTLMHLRLNLPMQHMAHLFCIDQSTVSTTFTNTIDVMFTHLAAGNMPLSMVLPCEGEEVVLLDKIVTVCCDLTSMCPSIVLKCKP
ncbi:hypothetical protein GOODEAATRI_008547 [Goodea atripinnis]|uniref:Transposase Helix-turn-helix domain-containing protein n=1 Tax=Goodea atripinnis TaxID=208336 RepID=A0ABV0PWE9_9TELE